jgi:perosamine synthetase
MNNKIVPVNRPLLEGNEEKYLLECIRTGWISSEGPFIKQFEEGFAKYIGRNEGIAVANGSGALDIAVQALEIGIGDEVIMPTFTIISPAQSVVRAGALPVLVDSDPITWNMDVTQIESKITNKTKAILVVHIYGLPVDMDPILDLCERYNLFLIEDAAEMHGQTYNGRLCGTFGDISTFSFYPNKHITTGEGGMILVDDVILAERCRKLRNLAFEPTGRRFIHNELGWNYRMTNLQAAIGLAQLEKIDNHILRKREIGEIYNKNLKDLLEFQLPLTKTNYAENIYWVYALVTKSEKKTIDIIKFLEKNNIGTRPFFWCIHEQPVFLQMGLFKKETYPIAEKIARQGFYIPSGLGLLNEEIELISKMLRQFCNA